MSTTVIEVERKFLLSGLPPIPAHTVWWRYQHGFLPGSNIRERVTHKRAGTATAVYERMVKIGTGAVRTEVGETITDPDYFVKLWNLTVGRRVSARRCYMPLPAEHMDKNFPFWDCARPPVSLTWEITEFLDRNLVMAEMEFPDESWVNDPCPSIDELCPDWLRPLVVREVTGDPSYECFNMGR